MSVQAEGPMQRARRTDCGSRRFRGTGSGFVAVLATRMRCNDILLEDLRYSRTASAKGGKSLKKAEIGIIGGSGLYAMPGLTNVREERIATPFGDPSDAFILGEVEGRKVAFLARHGRGHRISPSELNFRANIFAMKMLGVERILSVSAVGSLKEEHKPTDFVIPDQFIDRTFARVSTFFGDGIVAHVGFGDPVCATVAAIFRRRLVTLSGLWARAVAPTSAWKGRSFRRAPNRIFIAAGAQTLSA